MIYSIGLLFGDEMSRGEVRHARRALEMLSGETGGIAFFPKSLDQVDEIAAEVARDIRSQYTLAYHSTKPSSDPGFRKVTVDCPVQRRRQTQRPHPHRLLPQHQERKALPIPGIQIGFRKTPGLTMICKGERVRKPQGYRQAAAEACFCLFALCLPYWQSLLLAGISGTLSLLLFTCLLLFAVARTPEIYGCLTANLRALPPSWLAPPVKPSGPWIWIPLRAVAQGPSLAPAFQRPPPLFS